MIALQRSAIRAHLPSHLLDLVDIEIFDSIASTNAYALAHPPSSLRWQVYLAECQTAGRGRLGRVWYSPQCDNIYLSLSWLIDIDHARRQRLPALSLVVGLGVVAVLPRLAPDIDWRLKWPNDVWGNGQKLAGILLESQSAGQQLQLVLGLGLNVRGHDWSTLDKPATSLEHLTGQVFDRNPLVAALLHQWAQDIPVFLQEGLGPFQNRWLKADGLLGKHLVLSTPQGDIEGYACGIDATGALQLRHLEDAQVHSHRVGEIQRLMQLPA